MTNVRLDQITKKFGPTIALDSIDLQIAAGELFFLLGPSGCGKTTLLRLIAGLDAPISGKIFFNERDVTALGTENRNAVMCFQSYALWPHMTVQENIAFGLDVRKIPNPQTRIDEVLQLVQMSAYAKRTPNQLSGGQQQRVALARALAVSPDCLLLDEPLSNLDAKLRTEMRSEIRRICKSAGCTTIYVTHDQKEALSIADRIALMKDGKLIQIGTPTDLYNHPANSFVADFVGHTNLIPGKIVSRDGDLLKIQTPAGDALARANSFIPSDADRVTLSIRPEHLHIRSTPSASGWSANLLETSFSGESSEHLVQSASQRLRIISMPPLLNLPEQLFLEFDPNDVVVLTN